MLISVKLLKPDSKIAQPFEIAEGATVKDLLVEALNGDSEDVEEKYTISVNREPVEINHTLEDEDVITLGPKKVKGGN